MRGLDILLYLGLIDDPPGLENGDKLHYSIFSKQVCLL